MNVSTWNKIWLPNMYVVIDNGFRKAGLLFTDWVYVAALGTAARSVFLNIMYVTQGLTLATKSSATIDRANVAGSPIWSSRSLALSATLVNR